MKKTVQLIAFLLLSLSLYAQQGKEVTIKGKVLSDEGEPLPNVTVYVKDKVSVGTATDEDGHFNITVDYGDKLVFSYIGFQSLEYVAVEDKDDLVVEFDKPSEALDEVMVVAMGEQRKISNVAAITSVDVKDLQVPAPSITNLLGGRVAGVISTQTSGEPGKNLADFWVRGIGTFGANSGALVLIDGLEGDL